MMARRCNNINEAISSQGLRKSYISLMHDQPGLKPPSQGTPEGWMFIWWWGESMLEFLQWRLEKGNSTYAALIARQEKKRHLQRELISRLA